MIKSPKREIISLKTFIETGVFGSIKIGATKEELIEKLGNKYGWGDFGYSQIIKYGWYEFFYYTETEKIYAIQNDHLVADCSNHKEMFCFTNKHWTIDTWFLQAGRNITFKGIKTLLTDAEIDFTIRKPYPSAGNLIECTNSGVTFDFVHKYDILVPDKTGELCFKEIKEELEDNFVLNGIRLFNY